MIGIRLASPLRGKPRSGERVSGSHLHHLSKGRLCSTENGSTPPREASACARLAQRQLTKQLHRGVDQVRAGMGRAAPRVLDQDWRTRSGEFERSKGRCVRAAHTLG